MSNILGFDEKLGVRIIGDSQLRYGTEPIYSFGGEQLTKPQALAWLWRNYGNVTATVGNATCIMDPQDVFILIAIENNSEDAA